MEPTAPATELYAAEFDWRKLTLIMHSGNELEINGERAVIDFDDWDDLRCFAPPPDRFGNISQPGNSALYYFIQARIENESDGEITLRQIKDKYFLVWVRRTRNARITLFEYIFDSFQTVLDRYQFPRQDAAKVVKWQKIN